jgi:hypothetical protein
LDGTSSVRGTDERNVLLGEGGPKVGGWFTLRAKPFCLESRVAGSEGTVSTSLIAVTLNLLGFCSTFLEAVADRLAWGSKTPATARGSWCSTTLDRDGED